ncbi:hypothetical protein APV28_4561 [Comamonas testosteroni]|nr:hypothetical protein APV28_4561 [Comamonas testosteroni]
MANPWSVTKTASGFIRHYLTLTKARNAPTSLLPSVLN